MKPWIHIFAKAVLVLAAIPGLACAQEAQTAEAAPGGTLTLSGGALSYRATPQSAPLPLEAGAPVPYRILATGPPLLITACTARLEPVTYAVDPVSGTVHIYNNMVPQHCEPPLTALANLAFGETDPGLGVTLLGTGGSALAAFPDGELALPLAGGEARRAYIATGMGGNSIYPFGATPELVAVDTASGDELWRAPLAQLSAAVEYIIWAQLDGCLVLTAQNDYEAYTLAVLDSTSGELLEMWRLAGQPAGTSTYPGPVWVPEAPVLEGSVCELGFYRSEAQSWQRLRVDCAALGISWHDGAPPVWGAEENTMPAEGSGQPGPGRAPFPQQLLPSEGGNSWSVPALVNADGAVLVVDNSGARWAYPAMDGSG